MTQSISGAPGEGSVPYQGLEGLREDSLGLSFEDQYNWHYLTWESRHKALTYASPHRLLLKHTVWAARSLKPADPDILRLIEAVEDLSEDRIEHIEVWEAKKRVINTDSKLLAMALGLPHPPDKANYTVLLAAEKSLEAREDFYQKAVQQLVDLIQKDSP